MIEPRCPVTATYPRRRTEPRLIFAAMTRRGGMERRRYFMSTKSAAKSTVPAARYPAPASTRTALTATPRERPTTSTPSATQTPDPSAPSGRRRQKRHEEELRVVDERRRDRRGELQPAEVQRIGDASPDQGNAEEEEPLAAGRSGRGRCTPGRQRQDREQHEPDNRVLQRRVQRRVGKHLHADAVDPDGHAAHEHIEHGEEIARRAREHSSPRRYCRRPRIGLRLRAMTAWKETDATMIIRRSCASRTREARADDPASTVPMISARSRCRRRCRASEDRGAADENRGKHEQEIPSPASATSSSSPRTP